jgi:nucleoside-diphosphate-sugar epimerase
VTRGARARILVTGATGFIGRAVTRRLLAQGERVTVLARPRGGASAAERIGAALGPAASANGLEVVVGDLAEPAAGLDAADLARLRATADTVIHCAGETVFFPEYPERFRAGHVDGPVSLLEALAGERAITWVQLSTAYVCGRRTGRVFEGEGDVGQAFHNPYERVKLEAETALRAAGRRRGADVRVVRPSAVVGRAPHTAGGSPSTLFFEFIRLVAALAEAAGGRPLALRIEASPRAHFNVVPVEYVARSVPVLARCPDASGGTFHLVAAGAPRQDAMLRMIAERFDAHGLALVDDSIPPVEATPLERRLHLRLGRYRDYLNHDVRFDDARARSVLSRHGVGPAALGPAEVQRLVAHALRGRRARPAPGRAGGWSR